MRHILTYFKRNEKKINGNEKEKKSRERRGDRPI